MLARSLASAVCLAGAWQRGVFVPESFLRVPKSSSGLQEGSAGFQTDPQKVPKGFQTVTQKESPALLIVVLVTLLELLLCIPLCTLLRILPCPLLCTLLCFLLSALLVALLVDLLSALPSAPKMALRVSSNCFHI